MKKIKLTENELINVIEKLVLEIKKDSNSNSIKMMDKYEKKLNSEFNKAINFIENVTDERVEYDEQFILKKLNKLSSSEDNKMSKKSSEILKNIRSIKDEINYIKYELGK